MKKLFVVILFLLPAMAQAQIYGPDTKFGTEHNRSNSLLALGVPRDTFSVPLDKQGYPHIAIKQNQLYIWDTTTGSRRWNAFVSGSPNSNIGSGYRLAVPGTNNVKTLFAGYGILKDSTSNANGITTKLDTTTVFPAIRATIPVTTSLPISSLTAATGTNDINNGSNTQTWRWNSATSGIGLELASSSLSSGILLHVNATGTAAFNNLKRAFQVSMSGANANANQTTYAARFSNASTGTGAVNIGIETQAGSSGYALIVPSNSGSVGIGTSTPDASALLDVTSTTRGAVLPRMNTTQMNAISSPVAGLMVYNSDSLSYVFYNGSAWLKMGSGGGGGSYTAGNGLTLSGSQFKLGGDLNDANTFLTINGNNKLIVNGTGTLQFGMGSPLDSFDAKTSTAIIQGSSSAIIGQNNNYIVFRGDSTEIQGGYSNVTDKNIIVLGLNRLSLKPIIGNLYVDTINTISSTTGRKVLLHDTTTGKVERIDPSSLTSTPTLQQVLTAGSTLTNSNTINGGGTGNNFAFNNIGNFSVSSSYFSAIGLNGDITINDSIQVRPHLGKLNIDSLVSTTDTTTYKPLVWGNGGQVRYATNWPDMRYDTTTLASFGAGARFASDTAAFTDSTVYGTFYHDGSDTLIITKMWAVMNGGSGDTLGVQVYYNDSLNVIGSAIATSTLPVNSYTVGNSTTTFTNQKIPPGNWVWCKTPTVVAGRKPDFLSVSIIGYKKRRL